MANLLRSSMISYHSTRSFCGSGFGATTERLTDTKLLRFVNELHDEIRMLKLENEILENTIMRLEPALMQGVYQAFDYATKLDRSSSTNIGSFTKSQPSKFALGDSLFGTSRLMSSPSRASTRKSSGMMGSTVIYGSGPKINVLELTELVSIEMRVQETNLKRYKIRATKQHAYLKAQLEEIEIRVSSAEKASQIFKQEVLINGWDKIAQRIPAETWIRFMREWVKKSDHQIAKLRLRTSTLNTQYRKFKGQIKLKSELSESLRPVDFEKLKMQNSESMKKMDFKLYQLKESKKLTGDANLNLVFHKKALMEKNCYLNKVMVTTKKKDKLTVELEKEIDLIQIEADILYQNLDEIRQLRLAYDVPDIMEYVEFKWEINNLKKSIRSLKNRTCIGLMSNNKKNPQVGEEKEEKSETST